MSSSSISGRPGAPPCLREFPALERLKAEMAGRALEILAVNAYEPKPRVKRFRRLPGNGIRVLLDSTGKETESWFVKVYPTSFLIDTEGRVVRMVVGEYDWDSAEARGWIEKAAAISLRSDASPSPRTWIHVLAPSRALSRSAATSVTSRSSNELSV